MNTLNCKNILFLSFVLGVIIGCGELRTVENCVDNKIVESVLQVECGFQNPEDIEKIVIDGTDFLIISQMSEDMLSDKGNGGIVYFNTQTRERKVANINIKRASQGQNNCLSKKGQLSPHGIFLYQLDDGTNAHYLAVINHEGGSDRIELYKVNTRQLDLDWVGCIAAAPDALLNDLVVTRNGDVFATQMLKRSDSTLSTIMSVIFGAVTGNVQYWKLDDVRMRGLNGTGGTLPNGIALSKTGNLLVSYTGEDNVKEFDYSGAWIRTYADIPAPDNMVKDEKGLIWVASNLEIFQASSCDEPAYQEACPLDYSVRVLDTEQGIVYTAIQNANYPATFGALSVAYPIYETDLKAKVWLGTWAGERIAVSDLHLSQ